ncbi:MULTISPECIES: DNA polymerase III subunit delta' [unclassified Vibrio]|uniref:DNA polymerase III subunit delta' n=1 Tax=Vibrio sp. HB236076 TaxID=3232307 RepID=A0AB39HC09_9VIBR|nr:DNA polymerase III subunit delta' [Vibrio sp. HB161653]MDP5253690.1 DNA polymerase III subunit delta' [Vibrio sp. HB161653]
MALQPWLQETAQHWLSAIEEETIGHSLILHSEVELGAEAMIELWAGSLLCPHPGHACGFCHSCQLLDSGNHPDYHHIQPDKPGGNITVDQIRQGLKQAQESSQLGGNRVFVITPAEQMNTAAANALLKTLEEPSQSSFFLLVCQSPKRLLATIRSRCQLWSLPCPSPSQALEWLAEQGHKDVPAYVMTLAQGSPMAAKQWLDDKQFAEFEIGQSLLVNTMTRSDSDPIDAVSWLEKNPQRHGQWWWFLLSDAQKVRFGQVGDFDEISRRLAHCDYDVLYRQSQALARLLSQLQAQPGLNTSLLFYNWLIETREHLCL